MIFQDPSSALDPLFTIGDQITEPLRAHRGLSRSSAEKEAIELLRRVGIPSPRERVNAYPHHLSGGMRQRAMIAIAISCKPELMLADEPTTSLDVTIQDQILGLLGELREEYGMSMVLVSHDLGVIAQNADSVAVMYSGSIVETAPTRQIFSATRHPYTAALIQALPSIHVEEPRRIPEPIPGQPPSLDGGRPGVAVVRAVRRPVPARPRGVRHPHPGGRAGWRPGRRMMYLEAVDSAISKLSFSNSP